jgi:hypothetical protein
VFTHPPVPIFPILLTRHLHLIPRQHLSPAGKCLATCPFQASPALVHRLRKKIDGVDGRDSPVSVLAEVARVGGWLGSALAVGNGGCFEHPRSASVGKTWRLASRPCVRVFRSLRTTYLRGYPSTVMPGPGRPATSIMDAYLPLSHFLTLTHVADLLHFRIDTAMPNQTMLW